MFPSSLAMALWAAVNDRFSRVNANAMLAGRDGCTLTRRISAHPVGISGHPSLTRGTRLSWHNGEVVCVRRRGAMRRGFVHGGSGVTRDQLDRCLGNRGLIRMVPVVDDTVLGSGRTTVVLLLNVCTHVVVLNVAEATSSLGDSGGRESSLEAIMKLSPVRVAQALGDLPLELTLLEGASPGVALLLRSGGPGRCGGDPYHRICELLGHGENAASHAIGAKSVVGWSSGLSGVVGVPASVLGDKHATELILSSSSRWEAMISRMRVAFFILQSSKPAGAGPGSGPSPVGHTMLRLR